MPHSSIFYTYCATIHPLVGRKTEITTKILEAKNSSSRVREVCGFSTFVAPSPLKLRLFFQTVDRVSQTKLFIAIWMTRKFTKGSVRILPPPPLSRRRGRQSKYQKALVVLDRLICLSPV